MKLVDHLVYRLLGMMLPVIGVWSVACFLMQIYEIYDGIDEGLINLKQEFIRQANTEPGFVNDMEKHNPLNIIVKKADYDSVKHLEERAYTGMVYFATEEEEEEVRLLETAFRCDLNGQYYTLKIFTSNVESNDLIKNILYSLIAFYFVLALTLIFTGKKVIRRATRPFFHLLEKLEHFNLDEAGMIDFPKTQVKEFNALNNSVKKLLENNIRIYNEQKRFIENAAHELQTPLAIVIGKLELLINRQDIQPEPLKEISSALNILGKMKRLNSSLLLLSKIKNKQFPKSRQLDLSDIFMQVFDDYRELTEHRRLKLDVYRQGNPVCSMNPDLALIMVSNLVKNAISHNIPEGTIRARFSTDTIVIANDGNHHVQGDDIFERYQTRSDQSQTLGLGLSIVKSITDLYGMEISYKYDRQHIITIHFPDNRRKTG
ncbi:MAG: HAMP domain-containing histidine kinase [Bacteroidales bacterium]|jgi:signal transduction histidine kinase|nr:HAMP domain-containing histidine kinase [Bacteroidales bacterium]